MVFDKIISLDNVSIKNIAYGDLEFARNNRNDKSITKYLRPLPYIKEEDQISWYKSQISSTDSYAFSTWDNNVIVGNVSIYNIKEKEAEFGRILLSPLYSGKGYGYLSTILSLFFAFEILKKEKVVATVNINNQVAINLYKKVGFVFLDTYRLDWGEVEYNIVISKKDFYEKNPLVEKIIVK